MKLWKPISENDCLLLFTNHKFREGLHVTFGLNDRNIQYHSWSAKGFGEAIELLIALEP